MLFKINLMIQNPILQYTPYIPGQVVDIEYNMIKRFDEEIIQLQRRLKNTDEKLELLARTVIVIYIVCLGLFIMIYAKVFA